MNSEDVLSYTGENDQAQGIISQFFGSGFEQLLGLNVDPTAIQTGSLLGEMLGIVNAFAMLAAGLVIVYTFAVGVMETAHTGESLGKRYSTLWTPIRTAVGVMLVAPFPGLGGFSVLQAVIMVFVSLSIGAANMLWQKELDYFTRHGTVVPIKAAGLPDENVVKSALDSMVCQLHQIESYNEQQSQIQQASVFTQAASLFTGISRPVTYELPGPQAAHEMIRTHSYGYRWGPACGEITIECGIGNENAGNIQQESAMQVCRAKGEALKATITVLAPLAQAIYQNNAALPSAHPSGILSPVGIAAKVYADTFTDRMAAINAQLTQDQKSALNEFRETGREMGWLSAGTWHWLMAKVSLATSNAAQQRPNIIAIDPDDIFNYEEEYLPLRASVAAYTQMAPKTRWITDSEGNSTVLEISGGSDDTQGNMDSILNRVIGPEFERYSVLLEDSSDPIATLAHYGNAMMNSGAGIVAAMSVINGTVSASKEAGDSVPVIGGLISAPGNFLAGVWSVVMTFLQFLIVPLMLAGGFLAYYLPLVPFIFWSFGVLAWLIMVAEALVAAPIWAVSHVIPEGEGFAGNQARQGWLMLLNILFRPILLVIGLFLSMIMMYFICDLAIEGFSIYSGTVVHTTGWGLTSLFSFVFLNIIFVGLIIAMSHKAHEMIYETADNVMRWIGSNVKPLGEAQGEAATHQTYAMAAGHVSRGSESLIATRASERQGGSVTQAQGAKTENGGQPGSGSYSADAISGASEAKERPKTDG